MDRRSVRCSLYHLQKYVDDEVCFPNTMPNHWIVAEKEGVQPTALARLGKSAIVRKTIGAMELGIDEIELLQTPKETLRARLSTALPLKDGKPNGNVKKMSFHRMQMSDIYNICLPSTWVEWE